MVAGSTRTPARPSCSTPSWAEGPGKVSRAYPKRRECSARLVVDVRRDVVGRVLGLLARVSHGNPKAEPSAHLDVVLSVATAASTPLCRSVARARCVLVGMVFVACGTRVQFTSKNTARSVRTVMRVTSADVSVQYVVHYAAAPVWQGRPYPRGPSSHGRDTRTLSPVSPGSYEGRRVAQGPSRCV